MALDWLQPFSEPTRRPRNIGLSRKHPAAVLVKALPFVELVSADRWFMSWSEPAKKRPFFSMAVRQTFTLARPPSFLITPSGRRAFSVEFVTLVDRAAASVSEIRAAASEAEL